MAGLCKAGNCFAALARYSESEGLALPLAAPDHIVEDHWQRQCPFELACLLASNRLGGLPVTAAC